MLDVKPESYARVSSSGTDEECINAFISDPGKQLPIPITIEVSGPCGAGKLMILKLINKLLKEELSAEADVTQLDKYIQTDSNGTNTFADDFPMPDYLKNKYASGVIPFKLEVRDVFSFKPSSFED